MKTLRITSLLCIGTVLLLSSCDKDDDEQTALQRLQNKWKIDSIKTVFHTPPTNATITYTGQAADYYDFRADGKLYTSVNGDLDTLLYNLINNNQIVVNNDGSLDTGNISTLSASRLVGVTTYQLGGGNYNEVSAYLSR